ncbi:hypothetical protein BDF21DRAFT_404331 [Thamnidium elegans]|nr:hypothetical protein BDF21DRAFT_404331 [Thamnidium elegans]
MVSAIRHKTNELKIELASEEIVLMGHASESAGKMLRGSVILNLTEPMKVRSVILSFTGKMKVSWSEGIGHHQHYHKQEKDIMEHKWQFVPIMDQAHKKAFTLGAGEHKWDFELMLPGDLPQSLEAEGGQVVYRLKATVERTAFLQNIVKKKIMRVVRCMLPTEFELIQTLEIHNTWAEKMMYDILLPSKVYARGHLIPITFHITPIAARLRVRTLTATLKEYCTYTANDCSKTDTRIVKIQKDEDPFPNAPVQTGGPIDPISWTKVISLDIPPMSSQMAFCDADNEMIRIRHKLKFVICLVNADGHLSELRCSVPVIIISSISEQAELNNLPAYEHAWQSVLCLESGPSTPVSEGMPTPPICHSSPMPVMTSNNHEPQEIPLESPSGEPLWWHGSNLSRVPSYRTAAQQAPVALSGSLPSYDQLAGSPRHAAMFGHLSMSPGQTSK